MTVSLKSATSTSVPLTLSRRLAAGLAMLFTGATLLHAVGLSDMAIAHNTAHDTRHAIGFPCH